VVARELHGDDGQARDQGRGEHRAHPAGAERRGRGGGRAGGRRGREIPAPRAAPGDEVGDVRRLGALEALVGVVHGDHLLHRHLGLLGRLLGD
jgi:hypothetical protein